MQSYIYLSMYYLMEDKSPEWGWKQILQYRIKNDNIGMEDKPQNGDGKSIFYLKSRSKRMEDKSPEWGRKLNSSILFSDS